MFFEILTWQLLPSRCRMKLQWGDSEKKIVGILWISVKVLYIFFQIWYNETEWVEYQKISLKEKKKNGPEFFRIFQVRKSKILGL